MLSVIDGHCHVFCRRNTGVEFPWLTIIFSCLSSSSMVSKRARFTLGKPSLSAFALISEKLANKVWTPIV
jgi:hypothetical protein